MSKTVLNQFWITFEKAGLVKILSLSTLKRGKFWVVCLREIVPVNSLGLNYQVDYNRL